VQNAGQKLSLIVIYSLFVVYTHQSVIIFPKCVQQGSGDADGAVEAKMEVEEGETDTPKMCVPYAMLLLSFYAMLLLRFTVIVLAADLVCLIEIV